MKVTTWALLVLLLVAGAGMAIPAAQGCPQAQTPAPAKTPAKVVAPRPTGHTSFIIAARMGWL